jgi:hypothetical protein
MVVVFDVVVVVVVVDVDPDVPLAITSESK